jgi:hypothetical protein
MFQSSLLLGSLLDLSSSTKIEADVYHLFLLFHPEKRMSVLLNHILYKLLLVEFKNE